MNLAKMVVEIIVVLYKMDTRWNSFVKQWNYFVTDNINFVVVIEDSVWTEHCQVLLIPQ